MTASSSVFQALGSRARTMSDPMLVAIEAAGLVAVLVVVSFTPRNLGLALPFISLSMFGLWGVAEHVRTTAAASHSHRKAAAISLFQLVAAVIGTIAASAVLFGAAGRAIGTVVS